MSIRELLTIEHKFKTLTILQLKLQQLRDEIFGEMENIQVTQDQFLPEETEAANFDLEDAVQVAGPFDFTAKEHTDLLLNRFNSQKSAKECMGVVYG